MQQGVTEDVAITIQPHFETFSDYLARRVLAITEGIDLEAYMAECENTKDIKDVIRVRQKMLNWFSAEMPAGLSCRLVKNESGPLQMCYVKD
jgi:hypothetical protein